jgi:hypothetical protein
MFRSCAVCSHPERYKLDAALRSGQQQKEIAAIFHLSKAALSRHRNKHLDQPAPGDVLAVEAEKWRQRADALWHSAVASEDVRGQAQACANGLRALQIASKRAEQEQEKAAAAPTESSDVLTLDVIDRLIAEADERGYQVVTESARAMGMPGVVQLWDRMHGDKELASAVLAFADQWITEHKNYALQQSATIIAN